MVEPFCITDKNSMTFSKPHFSHGPWKGYLVGVVGDVAAHEDDALWPNRVCFLPTSVTSIQYQSGTPFDGCDQAFTAMYTAIDSQQGSVRVSMRIRRGYTFVQAAQNLPIFWLMPSAFEVTCCVYIARLLSHAASAVHQVCCLVTNLLCTNPAVQLQVCGIDAVSAPESRPCTPCACHTSVHFHAAYLSAVV